MAVDAFKDCIIRRSGVAIRTVVPAARPVFVRGTDRKILLMRKECCGLPCKRTMTGGAIQRETCRDVAGTRCCVVIFDVAGGALLRGLPEQSVRMTTAAFHRFMDTARGELRLVMIEARVPGHRIRCVTEKTISDEPGFPVIR